MASGSYSAGDFRAAIVQFAANVGVNLQAIVRDSAVALADEVRRPISQGGHMPVKFGNLRNSLTPSTSEVPPTDLIVKGNRLEVSDPSSQIGAVASSLKLGDHLYLGFRASYAYEQELKHAFTRLAAQRWPTFVEAAAKKLNP